MIELDLLTTHADRAYPILAGLVTPRPIAWVTTLNEDGGMARFRFDFSTFRAAGLWDDRADIAGTDNTSSPRRALWQTSQTLRSIDIPDSRSTWENLRTAVALSF